MGLDLHAGIDGTAENEYEDTWYAPGLHAQWSYTGFARFRERLAENEGFTLGEMQGFHGDRSWDEIASPLKPLLNHSDCDGEMTSEEAAQVWPRLVEIAENRRGDGELEWNMRGLQSLIELLQGAAENGWTVLFR